MLDLAILGLLQEQPLHGYELRKRLGEHLGFLWGVSYGSLYPALARLERAGAIEEVAPDDAASPVPFATGSLAGDLAAARRRRAPRARPSRRTRRAYRITRAGEAAFVQLLLADPDADDERSFALKCAFLGSLPPEQRVTLLERRRAVLARRLEQISGHRPAAGLDRYGRSLAEHRTRSLARDLEWVDELLTAERSAVPSREEGATA